MQHTYWGGDLYIEPIQIISIHPTFFTGTTEADFCVDGNWQDTAESTSFKIDYVFKKGSVSCSADLFNIATVISDHHLLGGYLPY